MYFEKEVYSLFANPTAAAVIDAIVQRLGAVRFLPIYPTVEQARAAVASHLPSSGGR